MGLRDVTKRDAVLDAIDEYERVGQAEFLREYGVDPFSTLTIEYVGHKFAAMPTLNLAHTMLTGEPLPAQDQRDEAAAADQLRTLGFFISGERVAPKARTATRRSSSGSTTSAPRASAASSAPTPRTTISATTWNLVAGDLRTRSQISATFGGSKFSAVEFSARTRSILLFSDPLETAHSFDGWDADNPDVYYFTGEGKRGDQKWNKGNKAILDSTQAGQTLRLFEAMDEPWRPGGKLQGYIGAFHLDTEQPWRLEDAPDADGNDRRVIVFRLVREVAPPQG